MLVLERRERLGGACTLERPFADERFVVSPCAYVVGLLDERVIDELEPARARPPLLGRRPEPLGPVRGRHLLRPVPRRRQDPGATSRRSGLSKSDIDGYWAYEELFDDVRKRLRKGERDTWVGETPTRAEIEEMLGGDEEMIDLVFEDSIADVLDRYIADERLKTALYGQGIIGTWGGPYEPGHRLDQAHALPGRPRRAAAPSGATSRAAWGWSASRSPTPPARPARRSPAASRSPRIIPGEGVELEDGTTIRARTVICNADPKVALGLLGADVATIDAAYRERLEELEGPQPRRQVQRRARPAAELDRGARRGAGRRGRRSTPAGRWRRPSRRSSAATRGEPAVGFGEIYIQTGYDPSPAPDGQAADERLRPVRALRHRRRRLGLAARRASPGSSST